MMYQQKKSLLLGALALLLSFFSPQLGMTQGFTVIITVNQPVRCNGDQNAQITASVPGAGSTFQYLWSNGATTASIQGIGAGTYIVSVTSVTGGSAIATALLTEPPVLSLDIQIDGVITCINPSIQLTAHASGGILPYSYFWLSGQVDSILTASQGGSYDVVITDQNGCQVSSSANAPMNTEYPIMDGVDSVTLLCSGNVVEIEKICTNSTVVGYQWFGSNGVPISGAVNSSLGVDSVGNYRVHVTNFSNGCLSVDSVQVLSDFLRSTPTNQGPVYLDSIVIFTSGGIAAYTYAWRTATGALQSTTQNLTNAPPGFYFLTTSDATGCTTQIGPLQLQSTSGIISPDDAGISVFPNPATYRVEILLPDENDIALQVYNAMGQLIVVQILESPRASIDVSDWAAGCYILNLRHHRGVSSIKLLKE